MKNKFLGIDIGGSFLKGVAIDIEENQPVGDICRLVEKALLIRVPSHLGEDSSVAIFLEALTCLINRLVTDSNLCGIGISTAGIVDYGGKRVTLAGKHLHPLTNPLWIEDLKNRLQVPVILINDADAAAIGAASLGYLSGNKTIGVMPIGTGLGFTVWRNGRVWTPGFSRPLLGSVYTPSGSYDELASASGLATQDREQSLYHIFKKEEHQKIRDTYINHLSGIIHTANIIYHTTEILIGGGLAEAVTSAGFPLTEILEERIERIRLFPDSRISVKVMPEGNLLPLVGAVLLAIGENAAQNKKQIKTYNNVSTEKAYDESLKLNEIETDSLIRLCWKTEQEAGHNLEKSLIVLPEIIERTVTVLQAGGRLIYVGAGTSGRLAAIDTVEIACTFGFPRDKILTLIAGGVADASFDIETNFEEDASSVPELLLANLCSNDIVVGISVSGSAYYVQSALAYAGRVGAFSVLIQEEYGDVPSFCDRVIPLRSGPELIAGSTRMKAGTATKKIINFLSTTVMIKLGNVHGCYMTQLECINEKLIKRAQHILQTLFEITEDESLSLLEKNQFNLNQTINSIVNKNQTHE